MRSGWGGEIGGVYSLTAVKKSPLMKHVAHTSSSHEGHTGTGESDASSLTSLSSGDSKSINNDYVLRCVKALKRFERTLGFTRGKHT